MANVDLKSLSYFQHRGTPDEWSIEGLVFGQINLLVGKNATGKSRAVTIIAGPLGLSRNILGGRLITAECNFDAEFDAEGTHVRYVLRASENKVLEEKVFVNGELMLERDEKSLRLWYEKQQATIDHESTTNELYAARKDSQQHPYLAPLHQWAESVRYYTFGTSLGKDTLGLVVKKGTPTEFDDRDQDRVVGIFLQGKKEFPDQYVQSLLSDMNELGYALSEVDAQPPKHITLIPSSDSIQLAGQLTAIGVREDGIEAMYFQDSMSQGMFRALSVLAQVNYSQLSQRAHCIVIDDIGEGLDYDRSAILISLLRRKAQTSKFQLIMTTNDQFVMNHVPLDEWSVLQRNGNKVAVRNIHNSRQVFEDFRFVGMSNFAFFEMDFANTGAAEVRQLIMEDVAGDE